MPLLMPMFLLAGALAHAEPSDWRVTQQRSQAVGWVGVGATTAATASGVAMAMTIGRETEVGPAWYLPTLAVGLAGAPMAAGGSLRARRAAVQQGASPLSGALGVGSWISLGVMTGSVLVVSSIDIYAGLYTLAVAGPVGGVLVATLASAQLVRNRRVGRALPAPQIVPLVSPDRVGLGLGVRF